LLNFDYFTPPDKASHFRVAPVPELDRFRLTLTFPAFNAAREIYLESIDPRTKEIVASGCLSPSGRKS
jgi:hypothetical protein